MCEGSKRCCGACCKLWSRQGEHLPCKLFLLCGAAETQLRLRSPCPCVAVHLVTPRFHGDWQPLIQRVFAGHVSNLHGAPNDGAAEGADSTCSAADPAVGAAGEAYRSYQNRLGLRWRWPSLLKADSCAASAAPQLETVELATTTDCLQ